MRRYAIIKKERDRETETETEADREREAFAYITPSYTGNSKLPQVDLGDRRVWCTFLLRHTNFPNLPNTQLIQ